jgi:ABC-type nitrate/sulfonate/bicarbonate transport system permease component
MARALASGVPAIVIVVAAWQWWANAHPTFFLPTPKDIGEHLRADWFSGSPASVFLTTRAREAIQQTFGTALLGWVIAACLGTCLGAVLGTRRRLASASAPPLLILRSVPPVAAIPIAIVIFGVGAQMRIAVVAVGCLWPVLLNAVAAVATVDPTLRDVAALNRLSPIATFTRVLIPAAAPKLFAGLRIALALGIVLSVGSELFAGTGGVGGALLQAQSTFDVPAMWAALVVLAVVGAVVNAVLLIVERVALRWNTEEANS